MNSLASLVMWVACCASFHNAEIIPKGFVAFINGTNLVKYDFQAETYTTITVNKYFPQQGENSCAGDRTFFVSAIVQEQPAIIAVNVDTGDTKITYTLNRTCQRLVYDEKGGLVLCLMCGVIIEDHFAESIYTLDPTTQEFYLLMYLDPIHNKYANYWGCACSVGMDISTRTLYQVIASGNLENPTYNITGIDIAHRTVNSIQLYEGVPSDLSDIVPRLVFSNQMGIFYAWSSAVNYGFFPIFINGTTGEVGSLGAGMIHDQVHYASSMVQQNTNSTFLSVSWQTGCTSDHCADLRVVDVETGLSEVLVKLWTNVTGLEFYER